MSGSLIVVGGHSRHVGKTAVVESLLRCLGPVAWTGVKISAHSHGGGAALVEELDPFSGSQTARYLRAGASRAVLLRAPNDGMSAAAQEVEKMRAAGQNVIAESNRLVAHCRADLVLFVVAPSIADWKPSSDLCLRHADALVTLGDEDLPRGLGKALPRFRVRLGGRAEALAAWCQASGYPRNSWSADRQMSISASSL